MATGKLEAMAVPQSNVAGDRVSMTDHTSCDSNNQLPSMFAQLTVSQAPTVSSLDPARKKLTSVEAQRVLATIDDAIFRTELVTTFPHVIKQLDRLKAVLGEALTEAFIQHKVLQDQYEVFFQEVESDSDEEEISAQQAEVLTGASAAAVLHGAVKRKDVEDKMQDSCRTLLRMFSANQAAQKAVLAEDADRPEQSLKILEQLKEFRNIVLERFLHFIID